ncbi:4-hydroxy-3-methylbut-2-en-1-yl diphosphate synthase (flavodoxin) [Streptomyces albospinus]|uniref:4-hydroxy-3-methylbut-2-en-1-yl diphosphate synthase (Flavodoxin) n=1 Tax=Streptomyces albospinus TaxID=285515 RepID=A0ABQ2VJT9_9ACTN|nr:flavodoxin-dependent (E)-4-hydroxy-3-methylbut-2-enyl-diphosphate synthase [Streptomyces albospinus]GGU89783.1 4-hydroxy-3-methylbut-2-en-1-yl diphosphate synthase (flavodoxin) [Streptomyces albospinus]
MTAVALGLPALPAPRTPVRRRPTRQLRVGTVPVGGGAPVSVQTMTTTNTADVDATLRQIAAVTAAGCDIVRVAVPSADDAEALPRIVAKSPIPVIADIHFQPRYVFAALDAGCAGVRVASRCDYPLHLGVTEAGPAFQGAIKSAVAFGVLLSEGIGDTIRVSLSTDPIEQVKAGCHILASLDLRPRRLEIVSCPGCGRLQVDIHRLAAQVEAAFDGFPHPLRIAVMGCVVNGPGESREADLGVSCGNGKGQIFRRGQVVKTVPESHIVDALLDEAHALTAMAEPAAEITPRHRQGR